jgi:hypothetical protein
MQRDLLDTLNAANTEHLKSRIDNSNLSARISSYELAYKMQQHAPEAVDLSKESSKTQEMYGMNHERTLDFGRRCLLARRLVERGVRFIQMYSGGNHNAAEPEFQPPRVDEVARFSVSPVRARIHLSWSPWTTLPDGLGQLR